MAQRRTLTVVSNNAEPRTAPFNLELEQSLLGALLMRNGGYQKIADIIEPEDFHEGVHGWIFSIIRDLVKKGEKADWRSVKTFIGDAELAGVSAGDYMARLASEAAAIADVEWYAAQVKDLSARRAAIAVLTEAMDAAYQPEPEEPATDLITRTMEDLERVKPPSPTGHQGFVGFGQAMIEMTERVDKAYSEGGVTGRSTGLPRLDDALGGLHDSDLIIIAGRPGSGKSSLAVNVAVSVAEEMMARKEAGYVGFFSLEMTRDQLAERVAAERALIPGWRVRKGKATVSELEHLKTTAESLRAIPIAIDDSSGLSIATLTMRARDLHKRRGLKLLIVDYLQLLQGSGRRSGRDINRVAEVTEITTGLKTLAKELNIPIIALSQLNRDVEKRDPPRPQLSDLRESGSVEQDADIVMFVYREEYYLKQREPKPDTDAHLTWEANVARAKGRAEIIIGKQRHGPTMTVELGFDDQLTVFRNDPPETPDEYTSYGRAERGVSVSANESMMVQALQEALSEMGDAAPAVYGLPRDLRVVKWSDMRTYYKRLWTEPERNPGEADDAYETRCKNLLYKHMERAGTSLLKKRVIARRNPHIWLLKPVTHEAPAPEPETTTAPQPATDADDGMLI